MVDKLPLIFSLNPDLKIKLISFAKANIHGLTGELLLDFFHDTIIPKLIEEEESETGIKRTKEDIL